MVAMPSPQSESSVAAASLQRPVFVAIDLQERSETILNWGGEHATQLGAPLVITHIVHEQADSAGFYQMHAEAGSSAERMEVIAARLLNELLEKACKRAPANSCLHSAKTLIVPGLPRSRIAELGKDHGARLIIMGHNRRSGLRKLFRESVTDIVIRRTDIPILIV